MSSNKLPFYLFFDKLLYSTDFHGFELNFYLLRKNKSLILIGHSFKDIKKGIRQYFLKKIIKDQSTWNNIESDDLNLILHEKESYRIIEWILIRILLKIGLLLYWKECNIDPRISVKEIVLEKSQLNKPVIKIFSNSNIKTENIPFISISHSKQDVYLALCTKPVGIDTELINNHSEAWKKKIFSRIEFNNLTDLLKTWKNLSRETIYTIIWSLKESTLKIQDDISLGSLPKIAISISDNNIITRNPMNNKFYNNFITVNNNSVLVLTF